MSFEDRSRARSEDAPATARGDGVERAPEATRAAPGSALAWTRDGETPRPDQILALQRTVGNRVVSRMLATRVVQAKLTVGSAGDLHEQEADRIAGEVMRRLDAGGGGDGERAPLGTSITPLVQREAAPGPAGLGPAGGELGAGAAQAITEARGGSALPERVRTPMERAFGIDFGRVRVHADAEADGLSRSIGARAFTAGQDVFFRQGQYDPESRGGQELIAHELTHVAQQQGVAGAVGVRRVVQRKWEAAESVDGQEAKRWTADPSDGVDEKRRDGLYVNTGSQAAPQWTHIHDLAAPEPDDMSAEPEDNGESDPNATDPLLRLDRPTRTLRLAELPSWDDVEAYYRDGPGRSIADAKAELNDVRIAMMMFNGEAYQKRRSAGKAASAAGSGASAAGSGASAAASAAAATAPKAPAAAPKSASVGKGRKSDHPLLRDTYNFFFLMKTDASQSAQVLALPKVSAAEHVQRADGVAGQQGFHIWKVAYGGADPAVELANVVKEVMGRSNYFSKYETSGGQQEIMAVLGGTGFWRMICCGNDGAVEVRTGMELKSKTGESIVPRDAFSMSYAGSAEDTANMRWLQFVWREVEMVGGKKKFLEGEMNTGRQRYPLYTGGDGNPTAQHVRVDANPQNKSGYFDQDVLGTLAERTATRVAIYDRPGAGDWDRAFSDPDVKEVISRAHFNTFLVQLGGAQPVVRHHVRLTLTWRVPVALRGAEYIPPTSHAESVATNGALPEPFAAVMAARQESLKRKPAAAPANAPKS